MNLEERVAFLEGRVDEHARQTDGIREAMSHLEARVDARLAGMDSRLAAFEERVDRRFEIVDRRLDGFEGRVDRRFEALERRFDTTDEKYSRYFVWILTAQVTTLAAVVTAFVAR